MPNVINRTTSANILGVSFFKMWERKIIFFTYVLLILLLLFLEYFKMARNGSLLVMCTRSLWCCGFKNLNGQVKENKKHNYLHSSTILVFYEIILLLCLCWTHKFQTTTGTIYSMIPTNHVIQVISFFFADWYLSNSTIILVNFWKTVIWDFFSILICLKNDKSLLMKYGANSILNSTQIILIGK